MSGLAPSAGRADSIKCPFCSAPWSEENLRVYDYDAGEYCDSGPLTGPSCAVSISCHACKREMYRKEGVDLE